MTGPIGLLGGTFDPVHNGHLSIAREACRVFELGTVRFIVNARPPHRAPPRCAIEHRLAMLERAVAGDNRLLVDTRELNRAGPSYSVWTLRALRRDFPEAALCWMVGVDAWLGRKTWYRWYELSALAHFIVVERPGWTLPAAETSALSRDPGDLKRRAAGTKVLFDGPQVDLSASIVRCRTAGRESLSGLLPDAVREYIEYQGLYAHR